MYLIFTDESGTNKDSSIVLYGGLSINKNNLIKSEMMVSDITREFFGIDNMLEIEVHFVDIFNYVYFNRLPSKKWKQKLFREKIIPLLKEINLDKDKLSFFVIELFQFLAKVNAIFLVSVLKRNDKDADAYVFKKYIEFRLYNINSLKDFFNEDFNKTFNYVFYKGNFKIATFKDKDTNYVDVIALLEILRGR